MNILICVPFHACVESSPAQVLRMGLQVKQVDFSMIQPNFSFSGNSPTGSFPFLLILTSPFIAQLSIFCQSDGYKVVCFNMHSSHSQEFGEFLHILVSLSGFPFCELFISLRSFCHGDFLCRCSPELLIYSWAVANNSQNGT